MGLKHGSLMSLAGWRILEVQVVKKPTFFHLVQKFSLHFSGFPRNKIVSGFGFHKIKKRKKSFCPTQKSHPNPTFSFGSKSHFSGKKKKESLKEKCSTSPSWGNSGESSKISWTCEPVGTYTSLSVGSWLVLKTDSPGSGVAIGSFLKVPFLCFWFEKLSRFLPRSEL